MFDFIRQHRRLLQFVLLILIVPSFVVVGAWDFVSPSGSSANQLAEVDGRSIDRPRFDQFHRENLEQVSRQLGGQVSVLSLDSPAARLASLDRLIAQEMLKSSAERHRIRASDGLVAKAIAEIPDFQKDGQFNLELAQSLLKRAGYTVVGFEEGLRQELSADRLPSGLSGSAIASRRLARLLSQIETETRVLRVNRFETKAFLTKALPTEAETKAAFDANPSAYQLPEAVDIELLVLRAGRNPADLETFTNLVFEQSESLQPAADQLSLTILRIQGVRRDDLASARMVGGAALSSEARVALSNESFRTRLFSDESLKEKRNLPALEVGAGLVASARVSRHQPGVQQTFDQVAGNIRAELQSQKALSLAAKAAEAWVADQAAAGTTVTIRREDVAGAANQLGIPNTVQGRLALESVLRLARGEAAALNLGEAGTLAVRLTQSSLAPAESSEAKKRVAGGYNFIEQADAGMAFQFWMRAQEEVLKVRRYSDKLRAADS